MSDSIVQTIVSGPAASETPASEAPATESQTPGVESNPAPEAAAPTPEETDFSERFAALSRKEKYLRDQEERIKASAAEGQSLQALMEKLKSSPLAVLEEQGISLDDILAASLGEDKPAPTVEEQLKQLREEMHDKICSASYYILWK